VEFRILGSLEVCSAGAQLPVGGVRDQRVLAVLLLETGRTVPVARLVDAVWDGEPPRSAVKQVRNAVSRLRMRLGAGRIAADPAGYRITVSGPELDARVFDASAARASRYAVAGDLAQAAETLGGALALWRGERPWPGLAAG
jgi:DNA-binding SARP family transcriptional activator